MSITDKDWLDRAEAVVGQLESASAVEIVVTLARSSGNYRDARVWVAVAATWIMVGLLILIPYHIDDLALLPICFLTFALAYVASARPPLKFLLAPSLRRREQVAQAARIAFFEENVSATVDRSGILIYLSEEERCLEILPDYGVSAKVPRSVWNEVIHKVEGHLDWHERLLQELVKVKPRLDEALPRRSDDRDELPNRPRVLA